MEQIAYWDLPGPSRFMRRASERLLGSGRGLLGISAPVRRPVGFTAALADSVRNGGGGRVFEVDASDIAFERSIVHGLARSAGSSRQSISSVSDLVSAPELSAGTFLVDGMTNGSWGRWSAFLRSFGAEFERERADLAPTVVAILPPDVVVGDLGHIFGRDHHTVWRSCVSEIDTRLFVSGIMGVGGSDPLADRVAYEVVVALSGWDLTTAESLARHDLHDLLDPAGLVENQIAAVPSWSAGNTDEWDGVPFVSTPTCLANGDADAVLRRVWAAYSRVLSPFVSEVMEHFCRVYRDILLTNLPYRYDNGAHARVINEVSELEIGPIYHFLKDQISPAEASFLKGVVYMRNRIAHHRLPEASAVMRLSDAWEAVRYVPAGGIGWNWPRCGQEVLLVDGTAKSTGYEEMSRSLVRSLAGGESIEIDVSGWSQQQVSALLRIVPADFIARFNGLPLTDR